MYEYIAGKVAAKQPGYAVIEANGIGYKILADTYSLNELQTGQTAKLYTYLKVAEDDMSLFGFYTMEQKAMFEKLISISGIGPKAGIALLSAMRVNDIAAAILTGDDKAFTAAPGIGKKTAQRLVLELREKVEMSDAVGEELGVEGLAMDAVSDACAALVGLGYKRQEALAAVSAVKGLGDTAEELLALALKRMGG